MQRIVLLLTVLSFGAFDVAGAQALRDKIADSELHTLVGGGHLLHLESAAAVAPIYTAFLDAAQPAATRPPADVIAATFTCDGKKRVRAVFRNRAQPQVDLVLSDGRCLSLPQAKSASGARYANRDESIVFWNKGDGAFVEEQGKRTYDNCVERR
jgi:membrane-bound inhibitor of C-type lysozyme